MSVDKFKFVSPGIFLDEIDESALPPLPERMGPMIVGRFAKGPANRPVRVESFKEFVRIFGNPSAGLPGGDVWRSGALTAPTYAAYAVQAWLRNNSPCTVYRILGDYSTNAETSYASYPKALSGWRTEQNNDTAGEEDIATSGGAYGLFVLPNPDSYEDSGGDAATIDMTVDNKDEVGSAVTFTVTLPDGNTVAITGQHSTTALVSSSGTTTGTFKFTVGGSGTANLSAALIAAEIASAFNAHDDLTATVPSGAIVRITTRAKGVVANKATLTVNTQGALATNLTAADHSFAGGSGTLVAGSLAAIFYVNKGAAILTGTARTGHQTEGAGVLVKSTDQQFTLKVQDETNTTTKTATFNFDKDSDLYIRKVFNTDPTKTNSEITTDSVKYWLGESFDSNVMNDMAVTGTSVSSTGDFLGVILGLQGTDFDVDWADRRQKASSAKTGYFISQDTRGTTTSSFNPASHTQKLFRLCAHDSGEHANRDYKISLQEIKAPTDKFNKFGTFTLVVRAAGDNDNKAVVLERFSGLNMNPNSANYIKKVIGDKYYDYDETTKTVREHGSYENRSAYVRVEVDPLLDNAGAEGLLPYGVYGPPRPRAVRVLSGSTAANITAADGSATDPWIVGSGSLPSASILTSEAGYLVHSGPLAGGSEAQAITASLQWPATRLRVSSSEGNLVQSSNAYFGYQSNLINTRIFDQTNLDLLRGQPEGVNNGTIGTETEYSWIFTLDDVESVSGSTGININEAIWVSGSRSNGRSITAGGPGNVAATTSSATVLTRGWNRFTTPLYGGFDGLDVTEANPFRNEYLANGSATTNHAWYSVKKAIDIISDQEYVEFDLASIPGLTNSKLTTALVNACEDRADALAVIDIEGGYKPRHENTDSETARLGSVSTAATKINDLGINSSYGCVFYPWVRIKDSINDAVLYVPPSVVALGTFSSSQRKSAVWFAPAGFTRGGLSEGSSGLPVVGVRQRLTSADRDKLYDANINPIASFPAEGIVIFGQKTMQVTPSALDRINVRRLLIFLKKEISRIASRVLFDQNVVSTWDKFTGQVVPFLEGVQAGLGLQDFRVVLDSDTTTPDLVDRNILYAKIFLKPARAIEFIALDFIITRSGASFDD